MTIRDLSFFYHKSLKYLYLEGFSLSCRPVRSITAPDGQLILPKLFRRSIDYLKDVKDGFRGNLKDWLISISEGSRSENDRVVIRDSVEVRFSDLIQQRNSRIVFQEDLLNITFVEK